MHVLVIEDNRVMAENICRFLRARGHTTEHAPDGPSGLDRALSHTHEVIVLDLMLPGLDGLALCQRLREEARTRTPVLMLTARDSLNDKLDGFAAGGDDYLVKPFSLFELEARLQALVRRSEAPAGHPKRLQVADLEFDTDTQTVTRAGRPIKLRPTTRKILALLMRESHRVVSRAEIERHIWGGNPPEGDVLRVHMYAIRSAIDRPFQDKLLHNIYGTGYRIAPPDKVP